MIMDFNWNELISPLITAALSIAGTYTALSKSMAAMEQKVNDIKEDVFSLREKVETHNKYETRIAILESKVNGGGSNGGQ